MENQKATAYKIALNEQHYMRDMRRELHSLPELFLHKRKTSQRVVEELEAIGVPYTCADRFELVHVQL